MKKRLVVGLVMIVVFVFAIVVYSNRDRGYKTLQEYYDRYLSKDPLELAGFLDHLGKLDKFVEVDEENWKETRERAATFFAENEEIHQRALKVAQDYIDWQESLTEQDIQEMVVEQRFKREYAERMSSDSLLLADFLFTTGELDKFVDVNMEYRAESVSIARQAFEKDENIHQEALERAKQIIIDMQLKSTSQAPRSTDFESYEEYEAYMQSQYGPKSETK